MSASEHDHEFFFPDSSSDDEAEPTTATTTPTPPPSKSKKKKSSSGGGGNAKPSPATTTTRGAFIYRYISATVNFLWARMSLRLFLVLAVHPAASKKNALALLCERWGVRSSQVMAVGDNLPDLEMLRWAGTGVVMGNSPLEMREPGQRVAPSNDQAGVAWAVERFVLGKNGCWPAPVTGI